MPNMRSVILMVIPVAACVLCLIGTWAMSVINYLTWRRMHGYDRDTFQDVLIHSTTQWWKAWEWHFAVIGLIAISTSIVCLSLHLLLPRSDRHRD